jgi:exodeoxyribonuclease VII large subunit
MPTTFSITQLTTYLRRLLASDDTLQDVWVKGELSNFKAHSSGHWYFTLKDSDSQLNAVMFRQQNLLTGFLPREGDAVLAHGRIDVFAQQGKYQLYVDEMRPAGVGDLYQQFDDLKRQLEAEGLFDPARKQPLPPFPRRIGVVTSPQAAAFQDVLNVLRRRFPLAEVVLSPTLVQGEDAPPQICAALSRLVFLGDIDVILICRGGGSIEDLWAFNDEQVARAVAACPTPTVAGVGHETDFTIVDFVADVRAPTPSAAAELATPNVDDLRARVVQLDMLLAARVNDRLAAAHNRLASAARALRGISPMTRINTLRQRVDDLNSRLERAERTRIALLRERLTDRTARLNAANPAAILGRGYAIVEREPYSAPVTSIEQVSPAMRLRVRLRDGSFAAHVETKEEA